MRTSKIRHQFLLSEPLSAKLDALAAKPGASKSAIIADAVEAWLTRRAAHELEERFSVRLDRMTTALGRIERDGHVLLETLATFVRYELAINAPLADNDAAGRALGRDRFNAFVQQVGRQIAGGKKSISGEGGL
jgi:hypothetical protein